VSVVVDRPPVEVYYYMDDVTREPRWQPSLKVAEQEPPGPSRVGTRKRYVSEFLGREVENTYVVTEVEPGRRLVYESTPDSAVNARTEIVWEPEGVGTRVTMTLEGSPRGRLKLVPPKVLETAYRKELTAALQRLKAGIEGGS
jgi:uncharacterized membrane protein